MSAGVSRRAFLGVLAAAPFAFRLGLAGFDPRDAAGVARRSHPARDHVVVIGAGAFGGWSALALLRSGMRVTLVDAWGAGHSRASSGGETRVIRAAYRGVPVYTRMTARAYELWREAEKQWDRQVFFRSGALWMFAGDDAYVRSSIEPMRAVGLSVEQLSPAEAARRWPQMSFGDVRTVYLEPDAGYITARAACELVRETFVREGGEYRQAWALPGARTTTRARSRLSSVTLSDGGELEADRFVFALGPWMSQVFPDLIGRRIVATRQEVFFFGTPPGDASYDFGALPVWVHIGERLVYGTPSHEGRGLKVADDTAGPEVDPTSMDRTPSVEGAAGARAILRERFPKMADAPLSEARVCQYETSSDGHFLIDRHPQLENAWLVGGGSGHGYKMGPALGEHVAELMQGKAQVDPLFAYGRLQPRPPA